MSDRSRTATFGTWLRTIARSRIQPIAEWFAAGVRSAALIGAWLSLTLLFTVGGIVFVGTGVTVLGHSHGLVSGIATFVGFVGAYAVAPTLAQVVVVTVAERFEAVFDRERNTAPDCWGSTPFETSRDHRHAPCPCYG